MPLRDFPLLPREEVRHPDGAVWEPGLLTSRSLTWAAGAGASSWPHSGQVSKAPEATPATRTVVSFRSTVTSVRTAWLAPRPDVSAREEPARSRSD